MCGGRSDEMVSCIYQQFALYIIAYDTLELDVNYIRCSTPKIKRIQAPTVSFSR